MKRQQISNVGKTRKKIDLQGMQTVVRLTLMVKEGDTTGYVFRCNKLKPTNFICFLFDQDSPLSREASDRAERSERTRRSTDGKRR